MEPEAESSDIALLARVADSDGTALAELYERHAAWLTARLTRRCHDTDLVVDAVQDTFMTVWKDAHRFRGDAEVAAWLWGIAFRRMVSRLRSRKEVLLLPTWDTPAFGQVPAAEDLVLLGVEYGDLGEALRQLSPDFRAVVQAVVLDGLTTREAGHLLGVRPNTVKTRLHRARKQLRSFISGAALAGGSR